MGDFRIKYGLALGPFGTYGPRSDLTVFPENSATPDVTTGSIFYTQNTTNTAITYFNVLGAGGQPGSAAEGKIIFVYYKDGSTAVVDAGQMFLQDTSSAAYPAGTVAAYLYHNSAWTELLRNYPTQTPFQSQGASVVAGSFSVNATTSNVLLLSAASAGAQLVSLSGGQVGQIITLVNNSSNALTISADGVGNIRAATSAFILAGSGAVQLVNLGATWMMIRGAVVN